MIEKLTNPETVISIIQLLVLCIGFIVTIKHLKLRHDSRNVDFVINAEGQIDPLFLALAQDSPDTCRRALPGLLNKVQDTDIKPVLYIYFGYRHTSRIYYLLTNSRTTLGMSKSEQADHLETWMSELEKYNFDLLNVVHEYGSTTGEFNDRFLRACDKWIQDRKFLAKTHG